MVWLACTAAVTMSACSGVASHRDGDGFPDPGRSTLKGGLSADLDEVRMVHKGMTKNQLYPLLGPPHFDEGVFHIREWNYVLNLPDVQAPRGYTQCQLRLHFDDARRVSDMAWKPRSCVALLQPPSKASSSSVSIESMPHPPVRLAGNTLFDFNSAKLSAAGRSTLLSLVERARASGPLADVAVVGFTDTIGSPDYNKALSLRRARAVGDYLAGRGVSPEVIRVEGRGESDPLVQCPGLQGAALVRCLEPNRRVEVSGLTQP